MRWLPLADIPDAMRGSMNRITEPEAAAGLVLFAYAHGGALRSITAAAIADNGEALHSDSGTWRHNYGTRDGALFVALDSPGGAWHLTENEPDALAVAADLLISTTQPAGRVVAAGGLSGFIEYRHHRPGGVPIPVRPSVACDDAGERHIALHPSPDCAGLRAALWLREHLRLDGRRVSVCLSHLSRIVPDASPVVWLALLQADCLNGGGIVRGAAANRRALRAMEADNADVDAWYESWREWESAVEVAAQAVAVAQRQEQAGADASLDWEVAVAKGAKAVAMATRLELDWYPGESVKEFEAAVRRSVKAAGKENLRKAAPELFVMAGSLG